MQTYILVRPGSDQKELDDKINASLIENIRPQLVEFMGITPEEFTEAGGKYGVFRSLCLASTLIQILKWPATSDTDLSETEATW